MSTNDSSNILPFKRRAWKPIVKSGDGAPTDSKFSGAPYLAPGEAHPRCRNCGRPLPLFVQLDLDALPEPLAGEYGRGLLQLFYCTSEDPLCEVACEAFFPFAKSVLVRIVRPAGDSAASAAQLPDNAFPAKLVTGWRELEDFPNAEEGELLGIELDEDRWETLAEEGYPQIGDKLGGYPAWVQGVEYPRCPSCGDAMRLVFQIDSEDNLPYMFGDVGCGHITQCRQHPDQLAFGSACG